VDCPAAHAFFQEYEKALSVAARDYRPLRVQAMPMSVDFCVDGRQIGVVMGDEDDNLSLFVYAPETRESCGGQRLLSRGDMHIGARVACIMRVQSHVTDPICGAQDARQMMVCCADLYETW
jgi:cleavage and polyadenylation specificity factor subunit 1